MSSKLTYAVAVVAFLATSHGARAETWCVRYFGDKTPRACVFFSAQDCLRMMLIGPGGVCVLEPVRGTKSSGAPPRSRLPDPPRLTAW